MFKATAVATLDTLAPDAAGAVFHVTVDWFHDVPVPYRSPP